MLLTHLNHLRLSKDSKSVKLKQLFRLILNHRAIKTDSLASLANMKPATCARLLDELCHKGLILTSELGVSTGGRKPILYSINGKEGYMIGVEMSHLYSTLTLLNLHLDIIDLIKIKHEGTETIEMMISELLQQVKRLLTKHELDLSGILGIGLAIDHILERDKVAYNDYQKKIEQLYDYIDAQVPCLVAFGSGISFAALAEYRLYHHCQSQRFLFTTCDTEIRSSTIINHAFEPASISSAEAFGHTTLDMKGPQCDCGAFGCLKQYSSLLAIKNRVIQQIRLGKSSVINEWGVNLHELSYHDLFRALTLNDPVCLNALEEAAYYYGLAIANAILIVQPDVVVCGGTLIPKNNFFEMTLKAIEQKLASYPQITTKIYAAHHSYEIVAQGAGGMVLEKYLEVGT